MLIPVHVWIIHERFWVVKGGMGGGRGVGEGRKRRRPGGRSVMLQIPLGCARGRPHFVRNDNGGGGFGSKLPKHRGARGLRQQALPQVVSATFGGRACVRLGRTSDIPALQIGGGGTLWEAGGGAGPPGGRCWEEGGAAGAALAAWAGGTLLPHMLGAVVGRESAVQYRYSTRRLGACATNRRHNPARMGRRCSPTAPAGHTPSGPRTHGENLRGRPGRQEGGGGCGSSLRRALRQGRTGDAFTDPPPAIGYSTPQPPTASFCRSRRPDRRSFGPRGAQADCGLCPTSPRARSVQPHCGKHSVVPANHSHRIPRGTRYPSGGDGRKASPAPRTLPRSTRAWGRSCRRSANRGWSLGRR